MVLVVEDGSGNPLANGYISVAFADTHHEDRGNVRWSEFATAQKESAIIRATDYIDKRFGRRFKGSRQRLEQALEWPRLSAFDEDDFLLGGAGDLPKQLEKAAAEYALRAALYMTLAPDPLPPVPRQDLIGNAVAATGTLTLTGNALNNETVTIGSVIYVFKTVLTPAAFEVLIGATASDSLDNLIAAINDSGGEGTLYGTGTTPHPDVTAATGAGDTLVATSKVLGTIGNNVTTAETMANGSWGGSVLAGGANNTTVSETEIVTGEVTRKRVRVGPIEDETWYQTAAQTVARGAGSRSVQSTLTSDFHIPEYPEADMWLEELIKPISLSGNLLRGD